ncbi:hypothetical protein IV203_008555 [Nitzschia inconspicua]|uniref:Uncharacterized protein n=1 Tax=Nitzschia inconspicua TaxID=303405 RepID=A0A9K3KZK1_9STRA|nr:hypothetical protein IV203_008555 [Nitzschia inconspicua]
MQLPVARLESVACQQRARPEQERLRAELRKRRTKKSSNGSNNNSRRSSKTNGLALMSSSHNNSNHVVSGPQSSSSILIDTSDTTIHALGMIGERVVLATSVELECMDVPSATSLWVCPLTSNRFVTSLDMHLHTFDVLVSCSKNDVPSPSTAAQIQQPSSLMLLQHSKNNVEICDANSPMLVRSPSCTAIWDVGCDNRLMFVALSANRQELELVLVSGGSIEQWKVACKTKIPIKASGSAANYLASSQTKLTQSSSGEYTLVASSRGIRLYQTESLQLIHVYGDQLSLHGQSVMWKDCWLVGSFFHEGKGLHKSRQSAVAPWMEIDDWLAYSMKDDDDDSKIEVEGEKETSNPSKITAATSDLPPYIVGVTHIKGPPELCETLHVWKVEHASVVPSLSIPLPHKGDGALGLAGGGINNASGDDRVIVVTNDGQAHALLPKMESNFAGIMYPPGYQIITDNIEFIEEEDALDEVVEYDDLNDAQGESEDEEVNIFDQVEEEDMDEELKEAMRQSLLEHRRQEEARAAMMHDYDVDILNPQNKDFSFLPCRPEPYLRQFIHTPEDDDDEEDEEETEATKQPGERAAEESDVLLSNPQKEEMSSGASFIAHVLEALPNMEKPQPVEDEDCLSFTTTKVVVAVNPVPVVPARPGRGRKSRAGNVETMLKASINPYLQSMMLEQQGVPTDGSGSHFRKGLNASRDSNANIQLQGRDWNGSNTGHSTPDPRSATADEAAVALGLLGLSPTPGDAAQAKPTDVLATVVPPTTPGVTTSHGSAYLSASTLSSLPVKFGTGGHDAMGNKIEGGTVESMTASSDRGSVTEESVEDVPARPKAPLLCKNCHACRGRHVIHTCGKRALPIDYDEVAKAERERKEKEEEERKRQRAEKRRLADQRRREAKKLKQRELEDQRLREEEDERREREKERRLQEDFASQDLNRQRRNQIVASYAQYQEQGSSELNSVNYSQPKSTSAMTTEVVTPAAPSVFETLSTPQVSSTFEDLSRPRVGSIFEQASRMMDDSGAARFVSAGEMAAMYTKTAGAAARAQSHTCPAPLSIPPPPAVHPLSRASMASAAAQLEALDGLAALAELARVTPAAASKPEAAPVAKERLSSFSYAVQTVAPSTQTSESDLGSFTYAASHGFMSGEVKKGIPSYATIRGQANGDSAPNNGGSEEQLHQQTVETYVWPPRREEQD